MLTPMLTTPLAFLIVALGFWLIGAVGGFWLGFFRGEDTARKYFRGGGS